MLKKMKRIIDNRHHLILWYLISGERKGKEGSEGSEVAEGKNKRRRKKRKEKRRRGSENKLALICLYIFPVEER